MMKQLQTVLDRFVSHSKRILGETLVGIYLHGSAVMGCYNPQKSDIDLLVVIREAISTECKRDFMDMVVALNEDAPEKGIEMSIIKESVCNPFVYPTPYELHFSVAHLNWYRANPQDYVEHMNGTDPDLAAHVTITLHRGKTLYGKEIPSVFGPVSREAYLDSIRSDIQEARDDILDNPVYIILNLCRVLAYKTENLILSKQEGGQWALDRVTRPEFRELISHALTEYQTGEAMTIDAFTAVQFAENMLKQITE